MNTVIISGCLVSSPDFKDKCTSFTIVDNTFKGQAQFFNCVVFDNNIQNYVREWGKGFLVEIAGRLKISKWHDKKYTSIFVDRVNLLRKKFDDGSSGSSCPPPSSSPPPVDEDCWDYEDVPF